MYSQLPKPNYTPIEHHPANQSYMPYDEQTDHAATAAAAQNDHNSLVSIATPLLTLVTQIRHTIEQNNVPKLRALVIEEIKNFEQRLRQIDYPPRHIIAARYCLCTAIDEAVLSRPWGAQSIWVQESLLSLFHRETWGGERFYIILEDMAKDPRKNLDFLEFAYFLLSLGFEGKFYDQNLAIREEIRSRIFYRIRHSRQKPEKTLSRLYRESHITTTHHRSQRLKRLAWSCLACLLVVGAYFNYQVYDSAKSTMETLRAIGTVSPITTFSEVIQRPIITRATE